VIAAGVVLAGVLAVVIAVSRHSPPRHIVQPPALRAPTAESGTTPPGKSGTTTATPPAPTPGCPDFAYFDARPGDHCANIGGTLDGGRWTITVETLIPVLTDTGPPQLCSQVTAINRGSEVNLMTGLHWSIETEPPGSATHTAAPTFSGTINKSGYIQPGGTAQATVCFADIGHPGQVLVLYAGSTRAVWITNR